MVETMKTNFVTIAWDLESAGLSWNPEIGDEVSVREEPARVSILVDPAALSVRVLRDTYLWLPTLEQLVQQLEARQAVLHHAGFQISETEMFYRAVIHSPQGQIEGTGFTLRSALGVSLRDLLRIDTDHIH